MGFSVVRCAYRAREQGATTSHSDSPTPQRVFWAVMEGVVATVLLIGGGLATLQTASVSTGLPFAVVLLIGVYSLYVGLDQEAYVENTVQRAVTEAESDHRLEAAVSSVVGSEQTQP